MTIMSVFKVTGRDHLKYLPAFEKNPIILEHSSVDLFFSCSEIPEREDVGMLPFHSGRQPMAQSR